MKVTTDACLFGALVANEIRKQSIGKKNILDIGSGTGLLALMVAQQDPGALIDAIEIDKDAYEQARGNAEASRWKDRICLFHGDVKTYPFPGRYDVIISNPPFYEKELKGDDSSRNKAHHDEGLLLKDLLAVIRKNLNPDGKFFLLLPFKRNEEIRKLVLDNEFEIRRMILIRQSINHGYFRIVLMGRMKTRKAGESLIDEMTITDENKNYMDEFREMLKDYYLYL